jgi:hypothetical protein
MTQEVSMSELAIWDDPTLKNVDTRKSFPCKAVTTCRHFLGYSAMRASFALRKTTKEAQYAPSPALDRGLFLERCPRSRHFVLHGRLPG